MTEPSSRIYTETDIASLTSLRTTIPTSVAEASSIAKFNLVCNQQNHFYYTGPPSGRASSIFDPATCCNLCHSTDNCIAYSYFGYNQTCLLYDYPSLYISQCLPEMQCLYSKISIKKR